MHFACMAENPASIHVLGSRQADLHAVGPSGFSPLHILAQSETALASVEALLKLGANVIVYDEVRGWMGGCLSVCRGWLMSL